MKKLSESTFASSVKKIFSEPKSNKYIAKIKYLIDKRRGKKDENKILLKQPDYSSSRTYCEVSPSDHISDISSDDSGVILTKRITHTEPNRRVLVTHATIEAPPKFNIRNSTPKYQNTRVRNENNNTIWDTTNRSDGYESIHDHYGWRNVTRESLDALRNNRTRDLNHADNRTDDKFVVNLFESRQSNRWKRKSCAINQLNDIKVASNVTFNRKMDKTAIDVSDSSSCEDADTMFYRLRKLRDAECVKMTQASNALSIIRTKKYRDWSEELLAEKILLETDLKYKLIVGEIRHLRFSGESQEPLKHAGTVILSNFEFQLKPEPKTKQSKKYTEFFILAVSYGIDVITTKVVTASEDKLVFDETFTLKDVEENFNIKAEVFSIKLKTSKEKYAATILKKKTKACCRMSKIYYENVNTYEVKESTILNSSFSSCAELTFTKFQIDQKLHFISPHTESRIKSPVKASLRVESLMLNSDLSGFLTMGKSHVGNNVIFWERKWCRLRNNQLCIYNYPQEEMYDKSPSAVINLEYCFVPLIKELQNYPRKRTFVLKTGRPSIVNDINGITLRRRDNFVLDKYYFSADTKEDFNKWTEVLESDLECLRGWNRLQFVDDYY